GRRRRVVQHLVVLVGGRAGHGADAGGAVVGGLAQEHRGNGDGGELGGGRAVVVDGIEAEEASELAAQRAFGGEQRGQAAATVAGEVAAPQAAAARQRAGGGRILHGQPGADDVGYVVGE